MGQMTDIHQHLIWGIDDGAATPEIMRSMLRTAHDQGIGVVVATAHARPGFAPFDTGLYAERLEEAQRFCDGEKLNVRILPGAEIAWTYQTALALRQEKVPALGNSDYVLLELWRNVSWQTAKEAVHQLIRAGYYPVLAHPERYLAFALSPKSAIRFRNETGALLQINADTVIKPRGFFERRFVRTLLSERAVDAVATDAHDCTDRPVNLKDACEWLEVNTDAAYARELTTFGGVLV